MDGHVRPKFVPARVRGFQTSKCHRHPKSDSELESEESKNALSKSAQGTDYKSRTQTGVRSCVPVRPSLFITENPNEIVDLK